MTDGISHIKKGSAATKIPMHITDQEGNELLCIHIEGKLMIGLNTTVPKVPTHIALGMHKYTDEDIRLWAKGVPSYPAWHKALLIEYLSQIIVSQVLDKELPLEEVNAHKTTNLSTT